MLKQREDVLKRYSEQKKRQEEEQKMVEEDKVQMWCSFDVVNHTISGS